MVDTVPRRAIRAGLIAPGRRFLLNGALVFFHSNDALVFKRNRPPGALCFPKYTTNYKILFLSSLFIEQELV